VKPAARYRALAILISPLWLIYTVVRSIKDGGRDYFLQRLGFYPSDNTPRLWIHAASVGEINTVLPLIQALQSSSQAQAILITTNTPTGKQTLLKQLPDQCIHRYLPVDLSGVTKRFLATHQIKAAWIVETEIWPWLFARCKSNSVPITIINGRITDKTLKAKDGKFGTSYAQALHGVTVLTKDDAEAARYRELSNNGATVSTVGNLKFSARATMPTTERLVPQRYVVAASTHDNEELQLAQAWMQAQAVDKLDCVLVIVPRHPERGLAIKNQLQTLLETPLRSKDEPLGDAPVYIADTLGELPHWFAHASGVFMGGSLIDRGGHNLLEPARLARLIVTGPSTFNFKEETQLLHDADALISAATAADVVENLRRAVNDTDWATQIGTHAQQAANANNAVAQTYLALLLPS